MIFKQNLSIYKMKRSTFYEDLVKNSKNRAPAVGTYTIKESPNRIKGCFKSTLEKSSSVIDDAVYHSMQVPSHYKAPPLEVYKERSPVARIHAESEREKAAKEKKWEKGSGPSPVSY